MRPIRDIFRSRAVFDAASRHVCGTDRESNHAYGDAYERVVEGYLGGSDLYSGRRSVRLMLEVGVADGSSLLAWQEVFPNARVVGMDLNPMCFKTVAYPTLEFHLADQRLLVDCERVAAGRRFDVIVDDASHQPADVLLGMLWLWPSLARGGLYVVEDLTPDLCARFKVLWPDMQAVETTGPFGGVEPLMVWRKPR